VEVTPEEVARLGIREGEAIAAPGREGPADPGTVADWIPSPAGEVEEVAPPPASEEPDTQADSPLAQTPAPTASWPGPQARTGIFPADSQIAVSRTHVLVTTNDTLAVYDKAGQLQQILDPQQFFLNPALGLPVGIDTTSDVRAIFDSYRSRFWTGVLVFNSAHPHDQSRLTKFAAAVSRTENPLDGWYLYWWDAVAHDGVPNDPVFQPGDSGDFPSLGIDRTAIYQTNAVNNEVSQQRRYWHVIFFPADSLANGQPAGGWQFWDLSDPNGLATGEVIQPVVHHGPSPHAFFASRYYAGGDEILVWALTDPLQPTQQIDRVEVSLQPFGAPGTAPQAGSSQRIKMDNLGSDVSKAVYRNGRLHLTANDARDWFNDGQILNSIRLVRLDVSGYPNIPTTAPSGFIDRVFGSNNSISDQPTDHMYYGWPAVEVNQYGDMVVVYARTGATIFPEVRLSAFLNSEADLRPSRLLKAGEDQYALDYPDLTSCNVLRWGDTAGASVDPADDTAIWVTQTYGSDARTFHINNWALWVGKLGLSTVLVPDCTGLALASAQDLLRRAGLAVGRVTTLPPEPPPGRLGPLLVVDQSPRAGIEVDRGTRVDLQLQRQRLEVPRPGAARRPSAGG
jgi:hypothetical protein